MTMKERIAAKLTLGLAPGRRSTSSTNRIVIRAMRARARAARRITGSISSARLRRQGPAGTPSHGLRPARRRTRRRRPRARAEDAGARRSHERNAPGGRFRALRVRTQRRGGARRRGARRAATGAGGRADLGPSRAARRLRPGDLLRRDSHADRARRPALRRDRAVAGDRRLPRPPPDDAAAVRRGAARQPRRNRGDAPRREAGPQRRRGRARPRRSGRVGALGLRRLPRGRGRRRPRLSLAALGRRRRSRRPAFSPAIETPPSSSNS